MPDQTKLALADFQSGNPDSALQKLQKTLSKKPENAFAWFLSAIIHTQQSDFHTAITEFKNALKYQPVYPEALNNMGVALEATENKTQAADVYEKAIKQKKDYANAYYNLANIQKNDNDFTNAIENYLLAIKYKPDYSNAMNNLALIYKNMGNYNKSETLLKQALKLSKNDLEIENNLGHTYFLLHQYDKAINIFQGVLEKSPDYAPTILNYGLLLRAMGSLDKASINFNKLSENLLFQKQAMNNLAHLELSICNFKDGWEHYRYRPSMRDSQLQTLDSLPGELQGSSILLYKDQGIGDEIFFSRYIPELKKLGAQLNYVTDSKLGDLWKHNLSNINIITTTPVIGEFDHVISIGDLPRLLYKNGCTDIPPPIALFPKPEAIEKIKNFLPHNGKSNIAVTWEAGVQGENSLFKLIPPNLLGKSLSSIDANILILQRNPKSKDIKSLEKSLGRKSFNLAFANDNLEEMLALLSLVDEYVCVSNTNTHLISALNRPCHVLIPHPPEWRWLNAGDQSPWFPKAILYRQDPSGSWDESMNRLQANIL
ncbi:MAG: tetratricopeptide repeat protein [Gammaproteobacteria bacterium]|nr:tetratricopeptide repeat protein [Gammaproteobacteria bacterium]